MNVSNELHVIFGTGPLGQSVMQALIQRGKRVRMVNRSGKASLPADVEVAGGDAYDVEFTKQVTKGAAVVYQCAQPQYHEWQEKFPPLQAAVLEAAAANNCKLILGENLYMYGDVDGVVIHEELPYTAKTKKGRVRAAMSQTALEAHRAGKVRVVIGRGSDFFGPQVMGSAIGERQIYPMLAGKGWEAYGNIDLPHSYTFIEDFGKALVILGERDEALGQAWHVPNASTGSTRELVTLFFKAAALPVKITHVNPLMLRFFGLFSPGAGEMVEMMYEFTKPFVVDSSKFERTFGMTATPYSESVLKTVTWYRENPHK